MHCARSHSHRLTLDQYIVLNKVSTLPVIWTFTMKHLCSTSNLSQIISATCIHFRRILACVQTHPQKAAAFGRLKSPWTTRLVVCRFGHVCGHPLNRRWSDLQFDSKRLQSCVCVEQIVQCTTYSYKKSYKMWRVFFHVSLKFEICFALHAGPWTMPRSRLHWQDCACSQWRRSSWTNAWTGDNFHVFPRGGTQPMTKRKIPSTSQSILFAAVSLQAFNAWLCAHQRSTIGRPTGWVTYHVDCTRPMHHQVPPSLKSSPLTESLQNLRPPGSEKFQSFFVSKGFGGDFLNKTRQVRRHFILKEYWEQRWHGAHGVEIRLLRWVIHYSTSTHHRRLRLPKVPQFRDCFGVSWFQCTFKHIPHSTFRGLNLGFGLGFHFCTAPFKAR